MTEKLLGIQNKPDSIFPKKRFQNGVSIAYLKKEKHVFENMIAPYLLHLSFYSWSRDFVFRIILISYLCAEKKR